MALSGNLRARGEKRITLHYLLFLIFKLFNYGCGFFIQNKKKQTNRKTDYVPMSILHSDVSELSSVSKWLFLNVINSESIYDRLEAVYGSM